jgi:PIN domain nuclease of toxin-antitoxin system
VSRFLVDTHVLLWWLADDPQLSPTARAAISDPRAEALVSAASAWEIAIKRSLGKLTAPAAQALVEGIPVVTADPGFGPYGVGVRW